MMRDVIHKALCVDIDGWKHQAEDMMGLFQALNDTDLKDPQIVIADETLKVELHKRGIIGFLGDYAVPGKNFHTYNEEFMKRFQGYFDNHKKQEEIKAEKVAKEKGNNSKDPDDG